MIIIQNFQTNSKTKNFTYFHTLVFNSNSKLFSAIVDVIKTTNRSQYSINITKFYCNIFNKEYQEFFFNNKIDDIFIKAQETISSVSIDILDIHQPDVYKGLLDTLLNIKFDYLTNNTTFGVNDYHSYSK